MEVPIKNIDPRSSDEYDVAKDSLLSSFHRKRQNRNQNHHWRGFKNDRALVTLASDNGRF
jgi:hypothetical protein